MRTSRRNFMVAAAGGGLGALAAGGTRRAMATTDVSGPAIVIPERQVPVLAEADVVVCGGGTAGISAACCAARDYLRRRFQGGEGLQERQSLRGQSG